MAFTTEFDAWRVDAANANYVTAAPNAPYCVTCHDVHGGMPARMSLRDFGVTGTTDYCEQCHVAPAYHHPTNNSRTGSPPGNGSSPIPAPPTPPQNPVTLKPHERRKPISMKRSIPKRQLGRLRPLEKQPDLFLVRHANPPVHLDSLASHLA